MDDWSRAVGESFKVAGENGSSTLKLVNVKPLLSKGKRPAEVSRQQAFAAVFEADGSAPAGDRMYELQHGAMSSVNLHVGQAVQAGSRSQLVAVFN
jgi:hypothetical protein